MADKPIMETSDVLIRKMPLASGEATAWHFHSEVDDYFVCLQGQVGVETRAGVSNTLNPGDDCQIASPIVHRVVNSSDGTSIYLLVQGIGTYDFCQSD